MRFFSESLRVSVYLKMSILFTFMKCSLPKCASRWLFPRHTRDTWFHCLAVFMVALRKSAMFWCPSLHRPACLSSYGSPISLCSVSLQHVQGITFPCLILLEIQCALSVGLDVFPSSEKLSAASKVVSYILPFLYKTPTKCILDGFSFYFP